MTKEEKKFQQKGDKSQYIIYRSRRKEMHPVWEIKIYNWSEKGRNDLVFI